MLHGMDAVDSFLQQAFLLWADDSQGCTREMHACETTCSGSSLKDEVARDST